MGRELKFRALYQHVATGQREWQFATIGCMTQFSGWLQITEWEQYTGLTDKHGREIYEGDIVRLGPGPYGYGYFAGGELVEVEMAGCGWLPFADEFDNEPYPKPDGCEVAGNVHEHSHMLGYGDE